MADPVNDTGGKLRYVVLVPSQTVFIPSGVVHFVFRLTGQNEQTLCVTHSEPLTVAMQCNFGQGCVPMIRTTFIITTIHFYLTGIILIFRVEHPIVTVMPPKKSIPPKKSKPSKKLKPPKNWSMYPSLHSDVSDLLCEDNLIFHFYEKDDDRSCTDVYDTNIMGRFTCRNPAYQGQ